MNKIKINKTTYNAPTPKKWRRIGDALLGAGTMLTGSAIMVEEKWFALVSLFIMVIGKFITNFYKVEK